MMGSRGFFFGGNDYKRFESHISPKQLGNIIIHMTQKKMRAMFTSKIRQVNSIEREHESHDKGRELLKHENMTYFELQSQN